MPQATALAAFPCPSWRLIRNGTRGHVHDDLAKLVQVTGALGAFGHDTAAVESPCEASESLLTCLDVQGYSPRAQQVQANIFRDVLRAASPPP